MKDLEDYGGDTKDYKRNLNRQEEDPSGGKIHDNFGKFRGASQVIESLCDENGNSKTETKTFNHLLRAKTQEQHLEHLREIRSKPAGSMSIQEQNALFPNNVELRLAKVLGKVVQTEAQKNLDDRLETDDLAL